MWSRVDLVWIDVSEQVPRSRIFIPCKMEAIRSSETLVHTRSTRRHILEDRIRQEDNMSIRNIRKDISDCTASSPRRQRYNSSHLLSLFMHVSSSIDIALNDTIIEEWWIGKDVEGNGHDFFQSTIPTFIWRDRRKPGKTSARIVGVPAEIEPIAFGIQVSSATSWANFLSPQKLQFMLR
jgi:hypothetical protein